MPLDLVMGSEKVNSLQTAIEKELARRNFSAGEDKVMAEYITIMLVNNKSPEQISSELEEFIGADIWDPSFTDWLFAEASKPLGAEPSPPLITHVTTSAPSPPPQAPEPLPIPTFVADQRPRDEPPHPGRRPPTGGARIYNQAVSGAQKRTASMRSPSPQGGPNKVPRRNDVPSGPRAMMREDGPNDNQRRDRPRSLRDRMGGFANGANNLSPNGPMGGGPPPNMMMGPGGFMGPMGPLPGPMGMMGMDPSSINSGALAEALMAQNQLLQNMMTMMQGGMMPNMQGMPPQMGPPGPNSGPQPPNGHGQGPQRGRGRGRGGRGGYMGDGGHQAVSNEPTAPVPTNDAAPPAPAPAPLQAPQPKSAPPASIPIELPNRPLSPTLCKYGVNCTNSMCRYSHPSAAATQESGIVLSTEACTEGRFCKDKDCKLSHPSSATGPPAASAPVVQHHGTTIPCKFGANCTRPGCTFGHPPKPRSSIPCKFGVNCTRPDCMFTHPPKGRMPAGGAGSISVRFNPDVKPFIPKGAAAPVILDTSSQPSSPAVPEKELKEEQVAVPVAEGQKPAELVAAI